MHIAYGCKSLSGIGGVRFQSMGEKLILNYQNVQVGKNCKRRRREAAIAEGKKPLTTIGAGGAYDAPQRIWGGAPETDAILNNFLAHWSTFWAHVNLIFCNNQIEKSRPMPKPSR